jgi:hypothetical protein
MGVAWAGSAMAQAGYMTLFQQTSCHRSKIESNEGLS